MRFLGYLIYGLVLFPLSLIPLPVLYLLSDGLRFILFDLVGYRKEVIHNNLVNSFPEKSSEEIRKIEKQFYRNFCDTFFAENIKGLSPFKTYLKRMMRFSNEELMLQLYEQKKGIILIAGHFGNWELLGHIQLSKFIKHRFLGIYKVQSAIADQILKISRGKSGTELIPMEKVKQSFETQRDSIDAYIFIGDQSPGNPKSAYWTTFLNQETGVLFGTEKFAKIYNYAVVYTEVKREKRGKYVVSFQLVTDSPKDFKVGQITEMHTRLLEKSIQQSPADWLWSHRRWKHRNPNKV